MDQSNKVIVSVFQISFFFQKVFEIFLFNLKIKSRHYNFKFYFCSASLIFFYKKKIKIFFLKLRKTHIIGFIKIDFTEKNLESKNKNYVNFFKL